MTPDYSTSRKNSLTLRQIKREELKWAGRTEDDSQIGHGATADVFKVIFEGKIVAWKKFPIRQVIRPPKAVLDEAELIRSLGHPNVVQLLGILVEPQQLGLVLELCEGSSLSKLLQHIDVSRTPVAVKNYADWALQVSAGMEFISSQNIVHRDVKAENIFVKEPICYCSGGNHVLSSCVGKLPRSDLKLKIGDFGLAIRGGGTFPGEPIKGTLAYIAPEVCKHKRYSESSDVWSFGVFLWEIITKEQPYAGMGPPITVAFNVAKNGSTLKTKKNCPSKWKSIMSMCWEYKATERPKFEQIVKFFTDYKKYLRDDDFLNEEEEVKFATIRSEWKYHEERYKNDPDPYNSIYQSIYNGEMWSETPKNMTFTLPLKKTDVGKQKDSKQKLVISRIPGSDLLNFSLVRDDKEDRRVPRNGSLPTILAPAAIPGPLHFRSRSDDHTKMGNYRIHGLRSQSCDGPDDWMARQPSTSKGSFPILVGVFLSILHSFAAIKRSLRDSGLSLPSTIVAIRHFIKRSKQ